jgi:hypothetical protein
MRFGFLRAVRWSVAAGLLIATLPAESALIKYTDRAAFEAATTAVASIDFEGIVPADSAQDFPNPDGLIRNGVKFRTSGTGALGTGLVTVYGADLAAQSAVLNTGTGAILGWQAPGQSGTAYLDVLLPPGMTAFATDIWAQEPFATTVRAIVNSGESTENIDIGTVDRPGSSFLGVSSDALTILMVRFSIPAGQVGLILDNVTVGRAGSSGSPVPEPGTMVLLCAGLAGAIILQKYKQG